MNTFDALFKIQCGHCGQSAAVDAWCNRPVTGELPHGHYQCPNCQRAFKRALNPAHASQPWENSVL